MGRIAWGYRSRHRRSAAVGRARGADGTAGGAPKTRFELDLYANYRPVALLHADSAL